MAGPHQSPLIQCSCLQDTAQRSSAFETYQPTDIQGTIRRYVGHFLGFGGILVIFGLGGVFWSFSFGFGSILVIFCVLGVILGFGDI